MTDGLRFTLLLSMVSACVSYTVSETVLISGVRSLAHRIHPLAGKLAACGYCVSHWVALVLVACLRPDPGWGRSLALLPLTVLLVAWWSGIQWAAMCWLVERTGR